RPLRSTHTRPPPGMETPVEIGERSSASVDTRFIAGLGITAELECRRMSSPGGLETAAEELCVCTLFYGLTTKPQGETAEERQYVSWRRVRLPSRSSRTRYRERRLGRPLTAERRRRRRPRAPRDRPSGPYRRSRSPPDAVRIRSASPPPPGIRRTSTDRPDR